MHDAKKTVFVLGAGFTKAFLPEAPLLEDDYGGDEIAAEIERGLPYAHRVLQDELRLANREPGPKRRLNLERLMTRLQGRMPYDFGHPGADHELDVLLSRVKRVFADRIEAAKRSGDAKATDCLNSLALHCIKSQINCVTFNYDDVFDQALCASSHTVWQPTYGYGFLCKPSYVLVGDHLTEPPQRSMLLLKLHGSTTWRARLGTPKPYPLGAIVHHSPWWRNPSALTESEFAKYLEPEPFMVPPVLAKAELVQEPLLRFLWSEAYRVLEEAEQVTFVGYSLPLTDIAAGTLFREALSHLKPSQVRVVDIASEGEEEEKTRILLESYDRVIPGIGPAQIDLRGGLEWAKALVASASEV
jgi:hypothetical protein